MDRLWYYAALLFACLVRSLPLRVIAAVGRAGGGIAYYVDGRHRRVALLNLCRCFPDRPRFELTRLAREHFRRLGENYISAIRTTGMPAESLSSHLAVVGAEKLAGRTARGAVVAIGHFGNFELYARLPVGRLQGATTYRALKQPRLEKLVRKLREESGCRFFDRRRDGAALREALARGGIVLGLLSDQHAGSKGLRVSFFGHECSVTAAPALLAQRYELPLHTAICFRIGLAQWQIEIGDEIPTAWGGRRRPAAEVMADVSAKFEEAVRRDPANWFWVHDRWRFAKGRPATNLRGGACR